MQYLIFAEVFNSIYECRLLIAKVFTDYLFSVIQVSILFSSKAKGIQPVSKT